MKKLGLFLATLIFSMTLMGCFGEGGCFIGDHFFGNGYKTIERAWEQHGKTASDEEAYEFGYDVTKLYFEGGATWFYVTKNGALANVEFQYANGGWWTKEYGRFGKISEMDAWFQEFPEASGDFVVGTKVLVGVRRHDGRKLCVNGAETTIQTHTLAYEGVEITLDIWYVEDCSVSNYEDLEFSYVN